MAPQIVSKSLIQLTSIGASNGCVSLMIWMSDKLQFVENGWHNDKLKFVGHPN